MKCKVCQGVKCKVCQGVKCKVCQEVKRKVCQQSYEGLDIELCKNLTVLYPFQAFERIYADNPGPMVVFATPGMLHGGLSLQIFKKWCTSENNMVCTTCIKDGLELCYLYYHV